MKYKLFSAIFILSVSLIFSTPNFIKAREIISLQFGSNIFVNNLYKNDYCNFKIKPVGIAVGFIIPINLPYFDSHYKVRVALHQIESVEYRHSWYERMYPEYKEYTGLATGINEILIGKKISSFSKLDFLPQIGFGFIAETIFKERGNGIVLDLFFIDFAISLKRNLGKYSVGVIMNYEKGFSASKSDYYAKNRINIGLLISI
jgi:hypothetical protein